MLFSVVLTFYCINLIIVTKLKVGGSYSDIGMKAWGRFGKYSTDLAITVAQTGFTCAYVVFIAQNLRNIIHNYSHVEVNYWWFGLGELFLFVPMVWVRSIKTWNKFHIFADLCIFFGLTVIIIFAFKFASDRGHFEASDKPFMNGVTAVSFIGTAIFAFEGIGIICPVMDET